MTSSKATYLKLVSLCVKNWPNWLQPLINKLCSLKRKIIQMVLGNMQWRSEKSHKIVNDFGTCPCVWSDWWPQRGRHSWHLNAELSLTWEVPRRDQQRRYVSTLMLLFRAQLAHTAGVYPGFCSMKPARSITTTCTPPGWDASPMPGYPSAFCQVALVIRWYPFNVYSWGEISTVALCPRTQHSDTDQGSMKSMQMLYIKAVL